MQQPLAHLYFLTVFEDLLSSNFGLSNLIRTSQRIAKVSGGGKKSIRAERERERERDDVTKSGAVRR